MRRMQDEEGMTVLDRLLAQQDGAGERASRGNLVLDSIARDLEALMNSRRDDGEIPAEYPEVAASILNFGMPALGRYGHIGTAAEQGRLCRAMEDAVRTFERRLKRPQVRVKEQEPRLKSMVRFTLEATLAGVASVHAGQREIFELRLEPETGEMTVAAEGGA